MKLQCLKLAAELLHKIITCTAQMSFFFSHISAPAGQNACDWIRACQWFSCLALLRKWGNSEWKPLSFSGTNIPGQQLNPQSQRIMSCLCGTCLKMSLCPLFKGAYRFDGLRIVQGRHFPDGYHHYILRNTWGMGAVIWIIGSFVQGRSKVSPSLSNNCNHDHILECMVNFYNN